ncbi:hypothetical protein G7067_13085 [Leucobacter insecticola]|uniref:Uncharacterized protein n=1 Tax=Leucobacter insecticola TaxID=2714934 RepID=A0A6G8FL95_9MICO|nr:hypothetical protein [Leucobacter insecticola]QIM17131.1 hypothetical protein G7067_13085 [Leucobacter insecticola]
MSLLDPKMAPGGVAPLSHVDAPDSTPIWPARESERTVAAGKPLAGNCIDVVQRPALPVSGCHVAQPPVVTAWLGVEARRIRASPQAVKGRRWRRCPAVSGSFFMLPEEKG